MIDSLEEAERGGRSSNNIALLGETDDTDTSLPPVSGKIKVKLSDSLETEVEASAYMAELRNEVKQLRGELATAKQVGTGAEEQGGLLAYMQGLGRDNVASLTSSVSEDVLTAMRTLIESILSEAGVGGESFMETSGLKLRELLVWQLITGKPGAAVCRTCEGRVGHVYMPPLLLHLLSGWSR